MRRILTFVLLTGIFLTPFSTDATTLTNRTEQRKQARLRALGQTEKIPYRGQSRGISKFQNRKMLRQRQQKISEKPTVSAETNLEDQVFALVNAERSKAGRPLLKQNAMLKEAALAHAKDMYAGGYFSHESPSGVTPKSRIEKTGYATVNFLNCSCTQYSYAFGENIAKGQTTAEEVMNDWMNSAGHKENILSDDFTEIGIAKYADLWVQEFGRITKW